MAECDMQATVAARHDREQRMRHSKGVARTACPAALESGAGASSGSALSVGNDMNDVQALLAHVPGEVRAEVKPYHVKVGVGTVLKPPAGGKQETGAPNAPPKQGPRP